MNIYEQFRSNNPQDVLNVYAGLKDKSELITFLRNFPEVEPKLYVTEEESDIVAVITLPECDTKHMKSTEELFKGIKKVYVESNGTYFNTSVAYNAGIKKALEFKPKWIVYSNDDVIKIDDVHVLKEGLESTGNDIDRVYRTEKGKRYIRNIGKTNFLLKPLSKMPIGKDRKAYLSLMAKFGVNLMMYSNEASLSRSLYTSLFMKSKKIQLPWAHKMWIFNANYVRKKDGVIFDRMCRNGWDDIDADFQAFDEGAKIDYVDFSLGHEGGKGLGKTKARVFRDIGNASYFCWKWGNSEKLKVL